MATMAITHSRAALLRTLRLHRTIIRCRERYPRMTSRQPEVIRHPPQQNGYTTARFLLPLYLSKITYGISSKSATFS